MDEPGGELFERAPALVEAHQAMASARGGTGRLVLFEGPAGIGKSRLLAAGRGVAVEAGFKVLAGGGRELERDFSCGIVLQLFERPARDVPELPAAVTNLFGSPAGAGALDEAGTFALLHGLFQLTAELAERSPVAVIVDDVHWGDVPSLRFLAYLVARSEDLPIAILAALRTGSPGPGEELIARMRVDPLARVSRLQPLGEESVAELVRATLGRQTPNEVCAACARLTGGNPFYLHEMLVTLRRDGVGPDQLSPERLAELTPASIARAVLLRAARLPGNSCPGIRRSAADAHSASRARTADRRRHNRPRSRQDRRTGTSSCRSLRAPR